MLYALLSKHRWVTVCCPTLAMRCYVSIDKDLKQSSRLIGCITESAVWHTICYDFRHGKDLRSSLAINHTLIVVSLNFWLALGRTNICARMLNQSSFVFFFIDSFFVISIRGLWYAQLLGEVVGALIRVAAPQSIQGSIATFALHPTEWLEDIEAATGGYGVYNIWNMTVWS